MDWLVGWRRIGLGWVMCGLIACGSETDSGSDGALGAGSSGTSDDGGSESTGSEDGPSDSSGVADDTGTESGSDTTEGDICMALDSDPAPAEPTLVEIVNNRPEPVYVGPTGGCTRRAFDLTRVADGEEVVWNENCALSCETLLEGECETCDGCDITHVYRIEPGATHTVQWNGLQGERVDAPPECLEVECQSFCERRAALEPGEYRFTVRTATECPSSEEQCACQPGASSCSLTLGDDMEASSSTSVDMSLPAPLVTVTIE